MRRFLETIGRLAIPSDAWPVERIRQELGGQILLGGAYRIHTHEAASLYLGICERAFPDYRGRWALFGGDWTGRQFVVDSGRSGLVSIVDPGFGEVLETKAGLAHFHDVELLDYPEASVLADLLADWAGIVERIPGPTECAGYQTPPFLGGVDELANIELFDLEVYLAIFAQMYCATRGFPDGGPSGSRDRVRGVGDR